MIGTEKTFGDWLEDPTIKELMSRTWGDSYTAKVTLDWTDTTPGRVYTSEDGSTWINDTATITGWYGTTASSVAHAPMCDAELMDWCDWFVDRMGLIFGKLVYFIDQKFVYFVFKHGSVHEFPRPFCGNDDLYMQWKAALLKDWS